MEDGYMLYGDALRLMSTKLSSEEPFDRRLSLPPSKKAPVLPPKPQTRLRARTSEDIRTMSEMDADLQRFPDSLIVPITYHSEYAPAKKPPIPPKVNISELLAMKGFSLRTSQEENVEENAKNEENPDRPDDADRQKVPPPKPAKPEEEEPNKIEIPSVVVNNSDQPEPVQVAIAKNEESEPTEKVQTEEQTTEENKGIATLEVPITPLKISRSPANFDAALPVTPRVELAPCLKVSDVSPGNLETFLERFQHLHSHSNHLNEYLFRIELDQLNSLLQGKPALPPLYSYSFRKVRTVQRTARRWITETRKKGQILERRARNT
eukprot:TRINITY_DN11657_c0_g1_i1.p1 TRINITY_DN11657_c0_g1~~TRINITY_DN11657_c0_g1_i1.p1  ORF type:complete len:322 (-),score=49.73 TRINITY_DN11657_c0_g1_i1:138-1103(-)